MRNMGNLNFQYQIFQRFKIFKLIGPHLSMYRLLQFGVQEIAHILHCSIYYIALQYAHELKNLKPNMGTLCTICAI